MLHTVGWWRVFADVDECSVDTTTDAAVGRCPAAATCQNTVGSYVCRCSYGFYGDADTCHSQSVSPHSIFSLVVKKISELEKPWTVLCVGTHAHVGARDLDPFDLSTSWSTVHARHAVAFLSIQKWGHVGHVRCRKQDFRGMYEAIFAIYTKIIRVTFTKHDNRS